VKKNKLYVEGGGDSKDLKIRCREGFAKLIRRCGHGGRMPAIVAGGSREATFKSFVTTAGHAGPQAFVGLLVDSEDPVADADAEKPWRHLKKRDHWDAPPGVTDDQAMLMTTCMESWIAADRPALRAHYGSRLHENALPDLTNLEARTRGAVQEGLERATRDCTNRYAKGRQSFEILGKLDPDELEPHLPAFVRFRRVLDENI